MPDAIDVAAALDFVLTLRRRWADTLYPSLRREFDTSAPGASGAEPQAVAPVVHALPAYPWFAWLERGSQKMLWRAVGDAVASAEPIASAEPVANAEPTANAETRDNAEPGGNAEAGGAPDSGPATLTLDPSLELPSWYTACEIHLQPGGVWSSDSAAAVYELGAKLVMLGENDDYKIHRLFTDTAVPPRPYRRIVDLGCGFGKSTWPLKKAFPQAEVIGIDLAAPGLRLAAQRANQQGLAIHFRQADASATGLESGCADLVTSTMLVHELPRDALVRLFAEAARLLAPGGVLRFLDFQRTGDAFRDLAMLEHGVRNNEPFLPPMLLTDVAGLARAAGLGVARWIAFDERARGRLDDLRWPERSEWHFPWAVLEAEKPS